MKKTKIVKLGVCSLLVGLLALTACGKKIKTTTANKTTSSNKTTTTSSKSTTTKQKITTKKTTTEQHTTTEQIIIDQVEVKRFTANSKAYDGKEVVIDYELSANVPVNFYFKEKGADDSTYTTVKPKEVGEYVCKLVIEETENYDGIIEEKEFFISGRGVNPISSTYTNPNYFATDYTGSEQILNIPGFDSNYMKIYTMEDGNKKYVANNELKNTSGKINFFIELSNENVYYLTTEDRAIEYTWNIVDPTSIITNVKYNGDDYTYEEFLDADLYENKSVNLTVKEGYSAYLAKYDYSSTYYTTNYMNYIVIKDETEIIYIKELHIVNTYVKEIIIDGKKQNILNEMYYYADSSKDSIEIELVDPTVTLRVESTSQSVNLVNNKATLKVQNDEITFWRQTGPGSYSSVFKLHIVVYDAIKSIDAIKYNITTDEVDTTPVVFEYGSQRFDINNDILLGVSVNLNEGYEDCTYRVIDRETGVEPNYKDIFKYANGYQYLVISVFKDGELIQEVQVTYYVEGIKLKGADVHEHWGKIANVLTVSEKDEFDKYAYSFEFEGENNVTLLIDGEEHVMKAYDEGVHREKAKFIKEVYGITYEKEFLIDIVCSIDFRDFGNFELVYRQHYDWGDQTYGTDLADYNDYTNCFSTPLDLYSLEHFESTDIEYDDDGDYTVVDSELVWIDTTFEESIAYVKMTIKDGEDNLYTMYAVLSTYYSMNTSLNVSGNCLTYYEAEGQTFIELNEDDEFIIDNKGSGSIYIQFESKLDIQVIGPDNDEVYAGYSGDLTDYAGNIFTKKGTYLVNVTNRKDETKTYKVIIKNDIPHLLDITSEHGTPIYAANYMDMNLEYISDGMYFVGCLGDEAIADVKNNNITVTLGGASEGHYCRDEACTDSISTTTTTFNLTYDINNNAFFIVYLDYSLLPFFGSSSTMIKVYLTDTYVAPYPAAITIGDETYGVQINDDNDDYGTLDVEENYGNLYATIKLEEKTETVTFKTDRVYSDYSYAIISCPPTYSYYDKTLAQIEEDGYLYRIKDANNLSITVPVNLIFMILGEGSTESDFSGLKCNFVLSKGTLFDIEVGDHKFTTTYVIDDETNAFAITTDADYKFNESGIQGYYDRYYYDLDLSEMGVLAENGIMKFKFNSDLTAYIFDGDTYSPMEVDANGYYTAIVSEEEKEEYEGPILIAIYDFETMVTVIITFSNIYY